VWLRSSVGRSGLALTWKVRTSLEAPCPCCRRSPNISDLGVLQEAEKREKRTRLECRLELDEERKALEAEKVPFGLSASGDVLDGNIECASLQMRMCTPVVKSK
jgi:hypothetical protein